MNAERLPLSKPALNQLMRAAMTEAQRRVDLKYTDAVLTAGGQFLEWASLPANSPQAEDIYSPWGAGDPWVELRDRFIDKVVKDPGKAVKLVLDQFAEVYQEVN